MIKLQIILFIVLVGLSLTFAKLEPKILQVNETVNSTVENDTTRTRQGRLLALLEELFTMKGRLLGALAGKPFLGFGPPSDPASASPAPASTPPPPPVSVSASAPAPTSAPAPSPARATIAPVPATTLSSNPIKWFKFASG